MPPAAAAAHALQPMLGDLHAHGRQVDDLTAIGLDHRLPHIELAATAIAAFRRRVYLHFIGNGDPFQGGPRMPFLSARTGLAIDTAGFGLAFEAI